MTEVVIGAEELITKLNAMSAAATGEALISTAQAGGEIIRNAAIANIHDENLIQTGNLSRSIHTEISEATDSQATVDIGTDLVYAAIHEFGGTITAKNGKYLAIPVGSYKGSPNDHPDLKLRKTGGGTLLMVDAAGTAQYVLKSSVTIPAQPYLRPAMDEHRDEAMNVMANVFKQLILNAAGVEE
jgi:HK97 gp10 family phage protein